MIGITKEQFIREYSKKLMDGNAALFIGAGLSLQAGFVDWKEMLREIADDLGLIVDREYDLIALAQYHHNQLRSRAKLNEKLIEEFTKDSIPTMNHKLISQLPIHTIWTTNYDTLIEDAFREQHKRVDVKITSGNITQTKPGIDVTIFKMHGDISQPQEAVLTKDDYEFYSIKRELFSIRLKGELVSQTFLFIGFSFTDPNIDYILSRIKNLLGQNTPIHYCIMKQPQLNNHPSPTEKVDYEYENKKLALRIDDLKRFGIQTILINNFDEITEILLELNKRAFHNNIFVSGSAESGSKDFPLSRLMTFSRNLGKEIIRHGFNLVSGYGLSIGAELIVGALENAYLSSSSMRERLILRPFPQSIEESKKKIVFYEWRKSMISLVGFSIYLAGNKIDPNDEKTIIESPGVLEEFEICTSIPNNIYPIPIGATGFVATKIWEKVFHDLKTYYGSINVQMEFEILNNPNNTNDKLIDTIFKIIKKVHSGQTN